MPTAAAPVPKSALATAREALSLVDSDPRAALRLAASVLEVPHQRGTAVEPRVIAHRASALALRETGDAQQARRHLLAAIRIADTNGEPVLATESRISLAFLESEAGRTARALSLLDACSTVPGSVDEARVATTRGLTLQRVGKHALAVRQYDRALELAVAVGDHVQMARIFNNRAMALAYLGRTDAARSDLQQAFELFTHESTTALAGQALTNEAWVRGMAGDIPGSLRCFDRSLAVDPRPEHPERWTDRAEVYLLAGMPRDAERSARLAVDWLTGRGWQASEAEAVLLLARCLLAVGEPGAARTSAARAASMLAKQGRAGWVPLAEYVRARAETETGSVRAASLVGLSRRLRDAGWRLAAVDVLVAAAATAIDSGQADVARRLIEEHGSSAGMRTTSQLRSRALLAQALSHELAAEDQAAQRALRSSFREIERRRALLGAADMRALSSTLAGDVVDAGLRLSLRRRDARQLFEWTERSRAASFRYRPALPDSDEDMREALTRLRWATRAVEDARLEGSTDRVAAAEAARWEGEVLRRSRRARGEGSATTLHIPTLRRRLGASAFLHIAVHRDQVVSALLVSGRTTLQIHGSAKEIVRLAHRMKIGTARWAVGGGRDMQARTLLTERLWAPIADACSGRRLVVSAPPELADIPWGDLPGFREQVLTVAPSAQAWLAASARPALRATAAALAGPGLPGGREEALAVATVYDDGMALVDEKATAGATLSALRRRDVVHVAAHGVLRRDNPLFSSLQMSDGAVTGYDLEQLDTVAATIVLSCCHAGRDHAVAPSESLGLASTLLRRGSRTVIAPLYAVDDESSVASMRRLHALIADGEDPAAALAQLRLDDDRTAGTLLAYGA